MMQGKAHDPENIVDKVTALEYAIWYLEDDLQVRDLDEEVDASLGKTVEFLKGIEP